MITRDQIEALKQEAARAGDDKQVRICEAALEKGEGSSEWRECERVTGKAAATDR